MTVASLPNPPRFSPFFQSFTHFDACYAGWFLKSFAPVFQDRTNRPWVSEDGVFTKTAKVYLHLVLKNFSKRFNTTMKRRFAVLRCYFSVFRITNLRKKFKGKWLSKVNSGLTAYLINLFTVNVHRHSSRLYQSSVTLTTWRDHTKITDLTRRWL